MSKNRDDCLRRYSARYSVYRHKGFDRVTLCFYCGDVSDTSDHVPPVTRVNDYLEQLELRELP